MSSSGSDIARSVGAYAEKTWQGGEFFLRVEAHRRQYDPAVSTDSAHDALPAWSLDREAALATSLRSHWPLRNPREWAWGGATGAGVRVCIVDSGVDGSHPRVGAIQGAVAITADAGGELVIAPDEEGDAFGHGTACASIVRGLAPDCEIHSVRVLGGELTGSGPALLSGLQWAIDQRFDVINLSLSTTKSRFAPELRELADQAYFGGCLLVACAHNLPVPSFPWRFSSVLSVGSHAGHDLFEYHVNPSPPVEFAAPGVDVELAWLGGATIRATGNSFAAPYMSGLAALVLSKHEGLRPFEVKTVLRAAATNTQAAT